MCITIEHGLLHKFYRSCKALYVRVTSIFPPNSLIAHLSLGRGRLGQHHLGIYLTITLSVEMSDDSEIKQGQSSYGTRRAPRVKRELGVGSHTVDAGRDGEGDIDAYATAAANAKTEKRCV